jgi:hypothetical protein
MTKNNTSSSNFAEKVIIFSNGFSSWFILFLSIIIFGFFLFFFEPILHFRFYALPIIIALISGLFVFLSSGKKFITKFFLSLLIFSIIYIVVGYLISMPLFRATTYQQLLGKVESNSKFENDIPETDISRIRIIDHEVAVRVGQKIIGTQTSLGSQALLGEFFIQNVKGKLYWVAPLIHSGFFKWLDNREGTPGYVMVSATDELDVKLVQEINGSPIKIKYQPGAYFFSALDRHVYFNGFMTVPYTDLTFEIDDEGMPYWVATLYQPTIGFSGEEATGIAIINPQTGEINKYPIGSAPKWVDRIQPMNFLVQQVSNWGEYVHGYFNFSHRDQIVPTGDMILIYGENDHCWWYQGMTSTGQDNSTVGFLLIDSHTKTVKFHKQTGATELAAMRSAEGKVQEKGYYSSHPIAYNLSGVPTYVMALKDQAGLIKSVAMVSIHDYSIVAVGKDVAEAMRNYLFELNGKGKLESTDSTKPVNVQLQLNGMVQRISADIQNGNTNWYFTLREYPGSIFLGLSATSPELPITLPGDSIQLGIHHKVAKGVNDIIHFDNIGIK